MFPRDFPRLPEHDPPSPLQAQEGDAEAMEHAEATSPSTTEDSYQGPVTYVLHRPRFSTTSRICWLATDTRSSMTTYIVERHWPDLYRQDYNIAAIHKSLQRDFPDAPEIQQFIILVDNDFRTRPNLRGVLVLLELEHKQELYAAPLATRTSEYGLLHWAGVLHPCRDDVALQCGAWINGHRLHGAESARLAHADYVKIALWRTGAQGEMINMIDVADLNHEEATYEEESPHGEPETPPSSGYIRSRSPSQDPLPPQDLYWICAALYSYTFGMVLLRLQAKKVERSRKRLVKKSPCIKAIFLISLILLQQVQPAATLMTMSTLSKQGQRHPDPGTHSRLPPPGNTCAIWDHESCIQRTPQGDHMINWLTGQADFKARSADIWSLLKGATNNCTVPTATPSRSGTVCSPILPISSENSPITIELDRLVPKQNVVQRTHTVDIGTDSNELEDLAETWTGEPPPSLYTIAHDVKGIPDRMLLPRSSSTPCEIEVYTDGSYDGKAKEGECSATWATIIFGKDDTDGHIYLVDWYGAPVEDDPLDCQRVGAIRHHIREAEASALIWAALYLMAHFPHERVCIYSDALAALNAAKGVWGVHPDEHIGVRLRTAYQLLERAKEKDHLHCRHVKSHTGILGNELADLVANALRAGELEARRPPRHYATWMQGDPPRITRAFMLLDDSLRNDVPKLHGPILHYGPPELPTSGTKWLEGTRYLDLSEATRIKVVSYNANTLRHPGAVAMLREQCAAQKVNIIGIQETRTQEACTYDTNYIRYVGVAQKGHGGVELWVSTSIPTTKTEAGTDHFQRSDATVIHAEPELLIVALHLGGVPLLCIVGHAPHRGHSQEHIERWWNHLRTLARPHKGRGQFIVCIDALGHQEPFCGQHGEQTFDTAGRAMLDLMQDLDLFAPSTFANLHYGDTATWYSAKTTNQGRRNDYILLDLKLWKQCLDSRNNFYIDAGNQAIDHVAVQATLDWKPTRHRSKVSIPTWDRHKVRSAGEKTWKEFFDDWPDIPWTTDVTTHMELIEKHLHQRLHQFFPEEERRKRNSCVDTVTIELMKEKQKLKKLLCDSKLQCQRRQLHNALHVWRHGCAYSIQCGEAMCVFRTTWRWLRYGQLVRRIKEQIAISRSQWLDSQIAPLQQANRHMALKILKPLKMGKRVKDLGKRPLQQVRLPDDSIAECPETATDRWRSYFAELEGGLPTTAHELWQDTVDRLQELPPPPGHVTDIPTLLEVERQFQKASIGKAVGADRLPGELVRMGAPWLARAIWPVVLKTTLWVDEPLQHKGGRLVVAYKNKGDRTQCHNHRGLLVSSSLGKALHNVWRARTQPFVFAGASDMQFTAQPHALVTQAAQCVRLYMSGQMSQGRSSYVLFLDIQAAYYRLLRQHSIQSDFSDESLILFLRRMGVDDITVPDLANILQGPNALEELQCPPHLQRVIRELHRSTWWRLDFDERLIRTERGTRPGDGLADVVWQLCFSRYLHRVDDCLRSLGIQSNLGWNSQPGFATGAGECCLLLGTIVWADDAAILGSHPDADRIVPQLQITAEVILNELTRLGMKPNMGKGKTEAILHVHGKGSKRVRQFVHHHCKSKLRISLTDDQDEELRIVPTYVHLGGVLTHDCKIKPEIKRKLAVANATLDNYKAKVLHNPKVSLEMRVHIFRATVAMALNYNLGTWPPLSFGENRLWCGGVLRLYKRLLVKHYTQEEQFHMTEGRLLSLLQLPHPTEILHTARLRHFAMCLKRSNQQFWALVAHDSLWKQQVIEAARWVHSQIKGHTVLPDPEVEDALLAWQYYMTSNEKRFLRVVKRAQLHAQMQRSIHAEVHHFHTRILKMLQQGGLRRVDEEQEETVLETAHNTCLICGTEWPTRKAWAVHSFKSHGRVNAYRQLQLGTRCEACGRNFANNARLTRHFRYAQKCGRTLAAQRRWERPQPSTGHKEVEDALPYDSMIPYIDQPGPTLPERAGWPMTQAMLQALKALTAVDWTNVTEIDLGTLTETLRQQPLHIDEFDELIKAKQQYYAGEQNATRTLEHFAKDFRALFCKQKPTEDKKEKNDQQIRPEHLQDLATMHFVEHEPTPRGHPRFHYVLHLFAGAKRKGDLHTAVATMECPPGALLFPVSLDVVLDPVKGDLLSAEVQNFWLASASQGLIFAVVAGPPCETWSVSRMRQLEGDDGPRPLRSTESLFTTIWALAPLLLRELKQLTFGNSLLHFSLLMMTAQCLSGNIGLLEHPSAAQERRYGVPPSIWRLPILQLLRRHRHMGLVHIKQGFYGSVSPKPTTFLLACRPSIRATLVSALHQGRTTNELPPPLKMQKTERGFSTMPLKRYPEGLCKAIAALLAEGATMAYPLGTEDDGISYLADHFAAAYDATRDDGDDGQDYFQAKKTKND